MTKKTIHYSKTVIFNGEEVERVACGNIFTRGVITTDPRKVNCIRCLRIMDKANIPKQIHESLNKAKKV